jgi:rhamnosyl/mannosyltransferase
LHFHFPWPFADVLNLLPAARNKPKVITYHSDIVRQRLLLALYKPLMHYTLGSMDAVVATSPNYVKSSTTLQKYVSPDRLKVIPLGIEDRVQGSDSKALRTNILDRLKLGDSEFVLTVGVLRYYKGLHTLVRSAPNIKGWIVIAGSGPEQDELARLAGELGAKNVIFAGQVTDDERDDLLQACAVFAFPSHLRSEAFGMALVEASMFSKPMICCEIGSGVSYVNQHNVTGLVIPPENPEELANAANRLLSDKVLATEMGQAARARYVELFSSEALGRNYAQLYCDVLARHRRAGTDSLT